MLTLYYKSTCPWCQKVMTALEEMDLQPTMKDITTDEAVVTELVQRGGKKQVPYLVDDERAVEMYESADIIAYLREHYATKAGPACPCTDCGDCSDFCNDCDKCRQQCNESESSSNSCQTQKAGATCKSCQ